MTCWWFIIHRILLKGVTCVFRWLLDFSWVHRPWKDVQCLSPMARWLVSVFKFKKQNLTEICMFRGSVERQTHWAYVGIHKRGEYVGNKTSSFCCPICLQRILCTQQRPASFSFSQVSSCCATKDVPQFSHLCHDALLTVTSVKVTSQSWRLEGPVLIVDSMNTSEGMRSSMNDPPITIRQSCLALMNT